MEFQKDILKKASDRKEAIMNNFSNKEELMKAKADTFESEVELEKACPSAEYLHFKKDDIDKYFDEIRKANTTEAVEKAKSDFSKLQKKFVMVNGEPEAVFVALKTDLVKAEESKEETETKEEEGTKEEAAQ